jgi:hypothetical protein
MKKLILILTLAGMMLSSVAVVETQAAPAKAKRAALAKAGHPNAHKRLAKKRGKRAVTRKKIQRLKAKLRSLRGR